MNIHNDAKSVIRTTNQMTNIYYGVMMTIIMMMFTLHTKLKLKGKASNHNLDMFASLFKLFPIRNETW